MLSGQNLAVASFIAVLLCLLMDYLFNNSCPDAAKYGPIKPEKRAQHPSREGFPGAKERVYIIAGGSGFTGSWIARYLLLRGETNVYILDRRRPPHDLIRHGGMYVEMELTSTIAVEREFAAIARKCHNYTKTIIYNCACIRRYYSEKNTDLGLQVAEILTVNTKYFPNNSAVFIHIGDAMSHREAVSFWKLWDRRTWYQRSRSDLAYMIPWASKDKASAFSRYAWYQGAIESLVRSISIPNGSLRPEGFITGHAGDHFLSPAISYGGGLLHSADVPISIISVEDVARAALALEYALLDPKTSDMVSGSVFSIEGSVTTLKRIYEYIQSKQSFHIVRVAPVVVYLFSWIVSVLSLFLPAASISGRDMRRENLLCGYPMTFTLSRFCTLQIAQVPNHVNRKRVQELLKFKPNFSAAQTIDGVLRDLKLQQEKGKKDA
ncbi:hypothetical protein B9G98_04678 [Wickerhamiella sorbophila]|uniref:Sterol-4-alpha-carboxylate 3-dehydrogenase, decarboxylating n=1 Tax=Wickerhamiella sorbophila TaxID=45607 RepID=A0A2T0FPZ3_9ASCO|nr:hypothetical protein B9G98_04678 [Wickerhamiella sorbophila]PRT57058.1 hypothetical protein B9G98_04678 [Wickerhamiella sorbophila]